MPPPTGFSQGAGGSAGSQPADGSTGQPTDHLKDFVQVEEAGIPLVREDNNEGPRVERGTFIKAIQHELGTPGGRATYPTAPREEQPSKKEETSGHQPTISDHVSPTSLELDGRDGGDCQSRGKGKPQGLERTQGQQQTVFDSNSRTAVLDDASHTVPTDWDDVACTGQELAGTQEREQCNTSGVENSSCAFNNISSLVSSTGADEVVHENIPEEN